jgi:CHAT domain-containing protein/tetratricopeptide (TPR) repeat protein
MERDGAQQTTGFVPTLHLALCGAALTLPVQCANGLPAELPPLPPGTVVEGTLAPETRHCYGVEVPSSRSMLFVISDVRMRFELIVAGAGLSETRYRWHADNSLSYHALIETPATGSLAVCAGATADSTGIGEYRLSWQTVADELPGPQRNALAAATQAAIHTAGKTEADWESAIIEYDSAARYWSLAGDAGQTAMAHAGVASLQSRLSRPTDAELAYDRALAAAANSGHDGLRADLHVGRGLARVELDRNEDARADFVAARDIYRTIGDRNDEAESLNDIALTYHYEGELDKALALYQEALAIPVTPPNPEREARITNNIGGIFYVRGEADEALRYFALAYEAHDELGNTVGRMDSAANAASQYRLIGEWDAALASYEQSRLLALELRDRRMEARVLSGIGRTYQALGRNERALIYLRRALPLRRTVQDARGEASTLSALGDALLATQDLPAARDAYSGALTIRRKIRDTARTTEPLLGLARVSLDAGEIAAARARAEEAVAVAADAGRPRDEAEARFLLGVIEQRAGRLTEAETALHQAQALAESVNSPDVVTACLVELARLRRDRGDLEGAMDLTSDALARIESLRSRIAAPELRATFLGDRDAAYALHTDVAIELARASPDGPWLREAFDTAERRRARMMLELLREHQNDLPGVQDSDLRARRLALHRKARGIAARLAQSRDSQPELEARLVEVLSELDGVESLVRRSNPEYAELTAPGTIDLDALQRLLGPGRIVLEYDLGEERAYLFAISSERVAVFDLAPTEQIETVVREYYAAISILDAEGFGRERELASNLSAMLLAPAAEFLDAVEIAIVADGALHYLPFGALPLPGGPATMPMVAQRRIVQPPSSALLLQHDTNADAGSLATIAILADPAFSRDDPRVAGAGEISSTNRVPAADEPASRSDGPYRLTATGDEARALSALFPVDRRLVATGPAASRARVMSGELASYSILHFATHGLFDSEYPMLSGITLSTVDALGEPVDGFLGIHDAHNLNLSAELIVLSGCETALGREMNAEGMVGLTHGFFYAGVPRVAASLWRVPERATAQLMTRFYEGMIVDGLGPGGALAAAQEELRKSRRWRDPYYWAGFTLQGVW